MEFNKKTLKNIFLGVAGCIVLYWILHETERFKSVYTVFKNVLSPFAIGAGLAFIINVPMRAFEKLFHKISNPGLRRTLALLMTFVAVALVLVLVFSLLIPQVIQTAQSVAEKLPAFFGGIQEQFMNFLNENPQLLEWVVDNTDFEKMNLAGTIEKVLDMAGNSFKVILDGAISAIGSVFGVVVNLIISIVFAIYCLFQKDTLARQARKLAYAYLPETWCDVSVRILRLANSTFSNFLSGQCIEVCILGCLFAVSMAIFQMPYIPLVSVLVAVTAFIPVVGAFVGCILGALFILVNDPFQAFTFVIMFLVLQQIENNLIYPRVVGTSIGLPGMWVLLAVAVGGELMGVAGMFLMIPMASVIYILLREITNARLELRKIDPDKLQPHPPELRSRLKEKREKAKQNNISKILSKKDPHKKNK